MEDMTATTSALVALLTSLMALFEVYPLNIILTGTLSAVAFKIFGKGKRAVS